MKASDGENHYEEQKENEKPSADIDANLSIPAAPLKVTSSSQECQNRDTREIFRRSNGEFEKNQDPYETIGLLHEGRRPVHSGYSMQYPQATPYGSPSDSYVLPPPPPPPHYGSVNDPRYDCPPEYSRSSASCDTNIASVSPPVDHGHVPVYPYHLYHPGYAHYHWAPIPRVEYVADIRPCDVLCGRGGATNSHSGNRSFRMFVKEVQSQYLKAKKKDKPAVAEMLVQRIRERGGRFLKRVSANQRGQVLWVDIGDERAKEKTCQALREGAPEIRRKRKPSSEDQDDGTYHERSAEPSTVHEADTAQNGSQEGGGEGSFSRHQNFHQLSDSGYLAEDGNSQIYIRPYPRLIRRRIPEAIPIDSLEPRDREIYLRDFIPPDSKIRRDTDENHGYILYSRVLQGDTAASQQKDSTPSIVCV